MIRQVITMNKPDDYRLINMSDVKSKPITWLWYPYIPNGKITILQGDPGDGKTTLILRIAAKLSKGELIIDQNEKREPINIIYQTAEDGLADTIKPRLEAAYADTSRVYVIDDSKKSLSMCDDRLEQALLETKAKLVILDPLQAFLGANVDMHRANEVRPIMSHLAALAEKYDCAVVLIGHMNKSMANKATYRGLGSIDIPASSRSVLLLSRIKDNPTIRVMLQIKNNLAEEGEPIAFELNKKTGFRLIGKYNITADELLNGTTNLTKTEQAEKMIKDILSDGIAKPQPYFIEQGKYRNICERTVIKAKQNLGVKSVKINGKWFWNFPKSTLQACE